MTLEEKFKRACRLLTDWHQDVGANRKRRTMHAIMLETKEYLDEVDGWSEPDYLWECPKCGIIHSYDVTAQEVEGEMTYACKRCGSVVTNTGEISE